jgi:hypothetical protein
LYGNHGDGIYPDSSVNWTTLDANIRTVHICLGCLNQTVFIPPTLPPTSTLPTQFPVTSTPTPAPTGYIEMYLILNKEKKSCFFILLLPCEKNFLRKTHALLFRFFHEKFPLFFLYRPTFRKSSLF